MHLDQAVRHLQLEGGVALAAGPTGDYQGTFDDLAFTLRASQDGAGFTLEACLGSLLHVPPAVAVRMLAANRWPRAEAAGVLAMETSGQALLLHHVEGDSISGVQLHALVRRFAWRARRWRAQLAAYAAPGTAQVAMPLAQGIPA